MNKKLLIGIMVVIVGLMIAMAILKNLGWAALVLQVALVGIWIYLVWMVWKRKTVSRYLKALKTFLLVAGISLAAGIVGLILVGSTYGGVISPGAIGVISMYIAIAALLVFPIATIGSLVMFLKGRRKTT